MLFAGALAAFLFLFFPGLLARFLDRRKIIAKALKGKFSSLSETERDELQAALSKTTFLISDKRREEIFDALARERSLHAVRLCGEVANKCTNEIATAILRRFDGMSEQHLIDELCAVWSECRNANIVESIRKNHWLATQPPELAVLTRIKFGSPGAIVIDSERMITAFLHAAGDSEAAIAHEALNVLMHLTSQQAVDFLCNHWIKSRDRISDEIIHRAGYVASHPVYLQVFTALKANLLDAIEPSKADLLDVINALKAACEDDDASIRENAKSAMARLGYS